MSKLLGMSHAEVIRYVDSGNNCGQDTIDLHEQITSLQARNAKLEKVLKVTKQVASINLTNPNAAWISDLVEAIKEAE